MNKLVVVGALGDWPLARRFAKLAGLPPEALEVPCYQVFGTKKDLAAVSKAFFRRKETMPPVLAPHEGTLLAVLEACTHDPHFRGESSWGFHGSATLDEVREDLRKSFEPRSPGEALAERRPSAAASLAATTKALAPRSIRQRKTLLAYLAGGPFRESLLEIDGHDLSYGFATGAECFGEVDRRLLFLWARCATMHTMFPLMPRWPEAGFDRRGAYVDELTLAGVPPARARDYVVVEQAAHARWWKSTGAWVWEQLVADRGGFLSSIRASPRGEKQLAYLLMAVAWLPQDLLAAGGVELLRELCASPALVPDRTLKVLLEDEHARAVIGAVERAPAPPAPSAAVIVETHDPAGPVRRRARERRSARGPPRGRPAGGDEGDEAARRHEEGAWQEARAAHEAMTCRLSASGRRGQGCPTRSPSRARAVGSRAARTRARPPGSRR